MDLIVEVPSFVPHMDISPSDDRIRQIDVAIIEVGQRDEGDETLSHTMNINGIGPIMEIFGCSIIPEEVILIKIEPRFDMWVELCGSTILIDITQGQEIIACVEVIDPALG